MVHDGDGVDFSSGSCVGHRILVSHIEGKAKRCLYWLLDITCSTISVAGCSYDFPPRFWENARTVAGRITGMKITMFNLYYTRMDP